MTAKTELPFDTATAGFKPDTLIIILQTAFIAGIHESVS